ETRQFGDAEFNRVAVVLAEGGQIDLLSDGKRPATDRAQKLAIRDAAVNRLLAGQYPLAADAYISFWTCGRTPTVAQAVAALAIEVRESCADGRFAEEAIGVEEGPGVNTATLSNTALRADNAIECTMGRIVDMAFHHAVKGDTELSPDFQIAPPPRRG